MDQTNRPMVQTDKGSVRGITDGEMDKFLGIPYAASPTGELRFRAPQPREPWSVPLDASKPGSISPQPTQRQTEDCLFLNVIRPSGTNENSSLPVYVFVHGGGFYMGSGSLYDGTAISLKADAIVVTLNYRMGILGFLAHPAIEDEAGDSGNYAILDVIAALRWVNKNISAFGGNPDAVTLGGESAGAMMTGMIMASDERKGLFQRAIIQDGPPAYVLPTLGLKYQQQASLPEKFGCSGPKEEVAARLRSPDLTVEDFLKVQEDTAFSLFHPSAGGTVIPRQPSTGICNVPTLMGFNEYEVFSAGYSFVEKLGNPEGPNPQDDASYIKILSMYYGLDHAKEIAKAYPLEDYANGNWALNTVESDYANYPGTVVIAIANNIKSFEIAKRKSGATLYAYEFNDPNAGKDAFTPPTGDVGGPVHTAELPYVFPHGSLSTVPPEPGPSQELSELMISYWSNFIRSGNPNGDGLPEWPTYGKSTDVMQLIPREVGTGKDVIANHRFELWQKLGYV